TTGVRVEADYDYMGRSIFKKVYNNNILTQHSLFAYDGFGFHYLIFLFLLHRIKQLREEK
ncbi:MAG: hypothetical protein J5601_04845, partial [Elusimicrobiaceae bacterium]|nr:hypothetical protein [Elusimicrobiaceae bacterium]